LSLGWFPVIYHRRWSR